MQVAGPQTVPPTCFRHSPLPSHVPSFMQVDAAEAGHWLAINGGRPAAIGEQVPTLPGIAQDMHAVAQEVSQQTPWTQLFEAHSAPIAQFPPMGSFPQLPAASQVLGVAQSAVVVQVVRQAPVPHLKGSQVAVIGFRHSPLPSQKRAWVNVVPVQVGAAHIVPLTYWRQAPAPLQVPSFPQLAAVAIGHWLAAMGGLPTAMAEQTPTVPVMLQAMQVPEQATSQQTPCSQWVDLHSEPAPQTAPFDFLSQIVPVQV